MKIATVYREHKFREFQADDMSLVRWMKVSEGLVHAGYDVDMIINIPGGIQDGPGGVRFVPLAEVNWSDYDVIKTLFHMGFNTLANAGGHTHPFIISKLGSVVGSDDTTPGVFFFGEERAQLYATQQAINEHSRYVSILTDQSIDLWKREHGSKVTVLKVPTGVDQELPTIGENPYRDFPERIALYLGTIYSVTQPEINRLWQERLNALGKRLRLQGIRLCLVGPGKTDLLDGRYVTYLGAVEHSKTWNYLYYADAGIVLAQGEGQHNESSKLYYYLRTGLPSVCEDQVPNAVLISEASLGLVAETGNLLDLAEKVSRAIFSNWDHESGIEHMKLHHTWNARIDLYDRLIREQLN